MIVTTRVGISAAVLLAASSVVAGAAELIGSSHPGRPLFDDTVFLLTAAVAWLVFAAGAGIVLAGRRVTAIRPYVMFLLTLNAGIALASAATLMPLRVRVALSEPWLRPYADSLIRQHARTHKQTRIALFEFTTSGSSGEVAFLSTGTYGVFAEAGLLYMPRNATNDLPPGVRIEHLYGPWWRFSTPED